MRLFAFFALIFVFLAPNTVAANNDIELLNSTLITKLHFDETPRNGQMIGAYQVSFRNTAATPISAVPMLLNPGLNIIKVVGANNRTLSIKGTNKLPIQGQDFLELTGGQIMLSSPLKKGDRAEVVIHYRGYMEDISWTGLNGVKETLNPRFTMIRPEAFAYPIFATPDMAAIQKAWQHKAFHQVASIEYPGSGTAVSNLLVDSKSINGSKTAADLKTNNPARLMAVAIGAYSTLTDGPITVSYLSGNQTSAAKTIEAFANEVNTLTQLLGEPGKASSLKIIEMPAGYMMHAASDALFFESNAFGAATLSTNHKSRVLELWKFNKTGRSGHWGTGLDNVLKAAISTPEIIANANSAHFSAVKQLFTTNTKLGKTALTDYIVDGFSAHSDQVNILVFSALYSILGRDDFYKMSRGLRAELSSGYADIEAVASYLQKNLKNKQAKKFVKNWIAGKKAGKDMAKAKSFQALVSRYK